LHLDFIIYDPVDVVLEPLRKLVKLVVTIFFICDVCSHLKLCNNTFCVENQVVILALDFLVDEQKVNVLEVGGVKFALQGLAITDCLVIACELSQSVTEAKNHLVIHDFQELA